MNRAWYPYQIVDTILFPDNPNFIITDPINKPINFISSEESTYRSLASKGSWVDNFFGNSEVAKELKKLPSNNDYYWDSLADLEHKYSNEMDMALWIQNLSNDTLIFPIQDGSLIGILESQPKISNWVPIEYWWLSWCGNSFGLLNLLPNYSIQIGVNIHFGGNPSRMRLKIHGADTIYLSNEFWGSVSDVKYVIPTSVLLDMKDDPDRISFLDTVHHWITEDPEIIIEDIEYLND